MGAPARSAGSILERVGLAAATLTCLGGLVACGSGGGDTVDMSKVHVSSTQADQAATGSVGGGTVLDTHLRTLTSGPAYVVTLRQTNGRNTSLDVDAGSGKVLGEDPGTPGAGSHEGGDPGGEDYNGE